MAGLFQLSWFKRLVRRPAKTAEKISSGAFFVDFFPNLDVRSRTNHSVFLVNYLLAASVTRDCAPDLQAFVGETLRRTPFSITVEIKLF